MGKNRKKQNTYQNTINEHKNQTYIEKLDCLKKDEEYKNYMETMSKLSNDIWDPIHDRLTYIKPEYLLEDRKARVLARIKTRMSQGQTDSGLLQKRLNIDTKSKEKILDVYKKLQSTLDFFNTQKN